MSAYTKYDKFLSHPTEEGITLIDHSIKVAKKSKEIIEETRLDCKDAAFYAGLLHDIGKLNPFYQDVFHVEKNKRKAEEDKAISKYERMHAPFSAWAAKKLLGEKTGLDEKAINIALCAIYGHHTILRCELPEQDKTDRYEASQAGIAEYLSDFRNSILKNAEFANLDWDYCITQFKKPIFYHVEIKSDSANSIDDFLSSSCVFSALLQADRGSFTPWSVPKFGLSLDTGKLVKASSSLANLRSAFQKHAIGNHDVSIDVSVLEAPTGIGKTKVFLDLIPRYVKQNKLDRVFYFSPLLALTEDFENKVYDVIGKDESDKVLSYDHVFSGSLKKKHESGMTDITYDWFENESFNKEFIITTTHRLMMTLYSNSASDRMKLISLRNSLLIIDEVQTISKFLLLNLIEVFKTIAKKLNSKILLVSATIPHEMKNLKTTLVQKNIHDEYLGRTLKQISFVEPLEVPKSLEGKTLFMSNTRKKNLMLFNSITEKHNDPDIIYISSGITKWDRSEILKKINNQNLDRCIVVSTQVLEAGVDVSFSKMYREMAPLDNIIQAMGRLNREVENQSAEITIFKGQRDDWLPYSELEWKKSLDIIKTIHTSEDLYDLLPDYYKEIFEENQKNRKLLDELKIHMTNLDFEKIWEFIRNKALPDDQQDSVYIPKSEQHWHEMKYAFSDPKKSKNLIRRFSRYTAQLPKNPEKLGIVDYFDDDLYERNVLLPKLEHISDIYDHKVGLDKWIAK